ncbi:UDP-glucose 4-epimerase GalE [Aliidiomarina quisquiliarum]|uniref:UDP-glucose 4-epimerase GalE n=1 Tax=Aliidiomarina quisquiliarum TaxID=2938947 RepID=UPI00208EF77A|nr:UDP-glucose 4-epimerase GalE [Aliidiomarina quisquiliarum]MCO4322410.1 UDP-glucose 4-epimerase GalE [Aliidiomarina quisquiliarum]
MILVTGGAGYIGSHTVLELLNDNYKVLVLDNLSNASVESLQRVEQISGRKLTFVQGDIRDEAGLHELFSAYPIEAVIHFAGLKAVGESVEKPTEYYDVNVNGSLCLVRAMQKAGVSKLVFSSSATVYGEEAPAPYKESMPRGTTTNPYGTSKAMVEQILTDIHAASKNTANPLDVTLLRYFNPIGAHESGLIGEDPQGIPNNLMPYISQVAVGRLPELSVFGDDYETSDGSGVRDYIHVVDLAKGHLAALNKMFSNKEAECAIYNLGSGKGTSVFELVHAFEHENGVKIPYKVAPRRAGDLATCYAAVDKAAKELNWRTEKTIKDMVRDTWRWQSNNPNGYKK